MLYLKYRTLYILGILFVSFMLSLRPVQIGADTQKYIFLYYEAQGGWVFIDFFFYFVAKLGDIFNLPYQFMFTLYSFLTFYFYYKISSYYRINLFLLLFLLAPLFAPLHWINQIRIGAAIPIFTYGLIIRHDEPIKSFALCVTATLVHFTSIFLIVIILFDKKSYRLFIPIALIAFITIVVVNETALDFIQQKIMYYLEKDDTRNILFETRCYLYLLVTCILILLLIIKGRVKSYEKKLIVATLLMTLIYFSVSNQVIAYRISELFILPSILFIITQFKTPSRLKGVVHESP